MKICLINNLYKPYQKGGTEIILDILRKNLEQNKHKVFIISSAPRKEKIKFIQKVYYIKSLYYNLEKIPLIFRLLWHIFDIFDIFTLKKIKKIIKQEKPDLVISNNLQGLSFLIPNYLKKNKIKHIHILHDIQLLHPSGLMYYKKEKIINTPWAEIYQFINKKLFNSPYCVISPSKWLLNLHLQKNFFHNSKTKIIPNPIQNISFQTKKEKNKKFTLLYVGQISKHKGVSFLLKTFQDMNKNNILLKIIGEGKELYKLKQKYTDNNIIFLGKKSNQETIKIISNSDCLVVPSLCYENSPTVIYEALQCQTPILASNIGGIPEIINKFGGELFETENKNDLQKKINKIINKKQKRKKTNLKNLSAKNYIEKILKI